jgi:hypothetical protein
MRNLYQSKFLKASIKAFQASEEVIDHLKKNIQHFIGTQWHFSD